MKQPHICLDETLGVRYAILPGDPARLDRIAQQLEGVRELAFNREFRSLQMHLLPAGKGRVVHVAPHAFFKFRHGVSPVPRSISCCICSQSGSRHSIVLQ